MNPTSTWECAFDESRTQQADLAARAASPEFEAVRAEMRAAIARFERHDRHARSRPPLANGMRRSTLAGHPIAPREIAFESGDHANSKAISTCRRARARFRASVTNHGSGIDKGTLDVSAGRARRRC